MEEIIGKKADVFVKKRDIVDGQRVLTETTNSQRTNVQTPVVHRTLGCVGSSHLRLEINNITP